MQVATMRRAFAGGVCLMLLADENSLMKTYKALPSRGGRADRRACAPFKDSDCKR
jgi:hypothetical protein